MKSFSDFSAGSTFPARLLSFLYHWGPGILWVAGIFIFSSRVHPLGPLSRSGRSGLWGRLAHVGEYAGLTVLVYRGISAAGVGVLKAALASLGVALTCAACDEVYQGTVAGRTCSFVDIGYDLVGMLMALGVILLWRSFEIARGDDGTQIGGG
jgi:VanZ family protein